MVRTAIVGLGTHVPERVVTNQELTTMMETSDEWIQQRTGIRQRHIAADGEFTSHLALQAADRALTHAGVKANELDLIVLATATPDETFPATATRVPEPDMVIQRVAGRRSCDPAGPRLSMARCRAISSMSYRSPIPASPSKTARRRRPRRCAPIRRPGCRGRW